MQKANTKKIAVLLPSMQVGGAERLVIEELAQLKDDSRFVFEVHLVFEKGPFFEELAKLELPVRVWNAPHKSIRMLKTYWDISMHLRRTHCDVLHCHLLNSIGSSIGMLAGVPTVTTVHGDIHFDYWARFGLKRNFLVLGCGQRVEKNISRFIKRSKVGLLNNAIKNNIQDYSSKSNLLKKMGFPPGILLILSLGRLTKQKGYEILINAIKEAVTEAPEVRLVIGGDGEDRQSLFEHINRLSLDKHVKMLGVVNNAHELLEHCDIYVNSSRWEGLPMTLIEAMAHGKPIIATNVGGNPDVILNNKTGLLVEPENVDSITHAILALVSDNALRKQLGANAKTLFETEYKIEKHCDKLAEYYMNL